MGQDSVVGTALIRVDFDDGVVTFRGSVEVPADDLVAMEGQVVERAKRVILNIQSEGVVDLKGHQYELEPAKYVIVSEGLFKEVELEQA